MNEIKVINPEEFGLEKAKANEITSGLSVALAERKLLIEEFDKTAKLEITAENIPVFRELRLRILKNRTLGINKWHTSAKDYFLKGGQFVDAIKRKEIIVNEAMEEKLMEAEKHFERLEKEKVEKLQKEREAELAKYTEDTAMMSLGDMIEEVWDAFIGSKKKQYEEKLAAEKKAEEERIAAIKKAAEEKRIAKEKAAEERRIADEKAKKERERIEAENAKLKARIERKKKADAANKKKEEAAKAKREAAEKAERDRLAAIAKAAEDKRLAAEAKAKAERERLQAIIDKKAEVERLAKEKAERDRQAKLQQGDADKMHDLIIDLQDLKTKYKFKSQKYVKTYADTGNLLDKIIIHIQKQ